MERIKQAWVFVAIALIASGVTFVAYRQVFPVVEQLDLRLKDLRFNLRGTVKPLSKVVIVAIDAKSVKEIGRWPWSREKTARLIDGVAKQGARVMALDMVFSESQGDSLDARLAESIRDNGRTILGYFFRDDSAQQQDTFVSEQLADTRIRLIRLADGVTTVPIPEFSGVDVSLSRFGSAARDQGFFNEIPDNDGLYRKAPLLVLFNGAIYPSLALQALHRYLDKQIIVGIEQFGVAEVSLGTTSLPVNEAGSLTLNYYGPSGTFPTFSATDIMHGRLPAESLKDAIVFVGATEKGIYDLRPTPLDPLFPGVEIHATVAANMLEQRFLLRDSRTLGFELAAIIALPIMLALLLAAVSGTAAGLGCFSLISAGYICLNYYLFNRFFLNTTLLYPLVSLGMTYLGGEAYRNLVVERKGRYLKKAFSTYISADLVTEIVKNPDSLRLGGEAREITILFSDIRSFTSISEKLTPESLVSLLNQYLSPMTRIIMEERGTLDKYVGDAIMALFNAPLAIADHPMRACSSAIRMLLCLEQLNGELATRGLPTIDIGIGIHTGVAVVGNMGADIRFDYTAIGDNVNLASRLEGLNKYYGTHILVSGVTRDLSCDRFNFREIDLVRVKGKELPVKLYELRTDPYPALDEFSAALQEYRSARFSEAVALFERLSHDQNDPVARMYVERCREYLTEPPIDGWDGVYTARGK